MGILVKLGPFPGALPSNLLVLLKPNGIEFLVNSSFQLLPWQSRNVMVPHRCIPSSLCIHNFTIFIFFVRSSPFCLLSDGSALLEKGFRFCMTTERAFAGRPNISFNVGMGFRQFQFHFQSFSIAIYLVYAGWSTRWSIQTNQQRRCCGRDNSKSTSLRWSPISRGSSIGGRTSCYRISSYWTPICWKKDYW